VGVVGEPVEGGAREERLTEQFGPLGEGAFQVIIIKPFSYRSATTS
jgi:hypothetical protein